MLGGVKDKYLFHENAGDQYIGRCASGLTSDRPEFDICRAHFDYSSYNVGDRSDMEEKVQLWLRERLPMKTTEHSFNLAYKCFADVCHKYNRLNETLRRARNVRSSPVFKNVPEEFLKLAKTVYA